MPPEVLVESSHIDSLQGEVRELKGVVQEMAKQMGQSVRENVALRDTVNLLLRNMSKMPIVHPEPTLDTIALDSDT